MENFFELYCENLLTEFLEKFLKKISGEITVEIFERISE